MISTAIAFALLPTLAVAATGSEDVPVVEEASAELQGDHLAAEITTTLPVFREDVRVKIDGRNLVVYLNGTVIGGGKRSFGEGPGAIHALPRSSYTKLEVPMPAGQTCTLPATINIEEGLIHVSVGCSAQGASAAGATAAAAVTVKPAAAKVTGWAARPEPVAKAAEVRVERDPTPAPLRPLLAERAAAAPKERSLAASGGSLVAPEPTGTPAAAPVAAPTEALAAKAAEPAKAADALEKPVAAPPVAAAPVAAPSLLPAADKIAPAHNTTSAKTEPTARAESTSPMFVGGGLVLLTVIAFVMWRRRRQQHGGMIRILETASLGPKRTLVVAEIDGEKMILGTSEAGISVLTPASRMPSPWGEPTGATRVQLPVGFTESSKISNINTIAAAAAHHHHAAAAAAMPGPTITPMTGPADENEGGLLSRLFRRTPAAPQVDEDLEGLGNMADEFQDLLADSIEDEDLRRRLQAGIGGRTS